MAPSWRLPLRGPASMTLLPRPCLRGPAFAALPPWLRLSGAASAAPSSWLCRDRCVSAAPYPQPRLKGFCCSAATPPLPTLSSFRLGGSASLALSQQCRLRGFASAAPPPPPCRLTTLPPPRPYHLHCLATLPLQLQICGSVVQALWLHGSTAPRLRFRSSNLTAPGLCGWASTTAKGLHGSILTARPPPLGLHSFASSSMALAPRLWFFSSLQWLHLSGPMALALRLLLRGSRFVALGPWFRGARSLRLWVSAVPGLCGSAAMASSPPQLRLSGSGSTNLDLRLRLH